MKASTSTTGPRPPDPSPEDALHLAETLVQRKHAELNAGKKGNNRTLYLFADGTTSIRSSGGPLSGWHMSITLNYANLFSEETMLYALLKSIAVVRNTGSEWKARIPGYGFETSGNSADEAVTEIVGIFLADQKTRRKERADHPLAFLLHLDPDVAAKAFHFAEGALERGDYAENPYRSVHAVAQGLFEAFRKSTTPSPEPGPAPREPRAHAAQRP